MRAYISTWGVSRTPQGVRGLKHIHIYFLSVGLLSHSARSAWIETVGAVGSVVSG